MNKNQDKPLTILQLSQVARFTELVDRVVNRPSDLPPFAVFYGPAGFGKTWASQYAMQAFRARYVELKSCWAQKPFLEAIMVELGLLAPRTPMKMTIAQAVEVIADKLAEEPTRPLIIDEADLLVKRGKIELVRDIAKSCEAMGSSFILIGEENLPNALKSWERVDSRVLSYEKAQPISRDDVVILGQAVCPGLEFGDDAIDFVKQVCRGSARRCVTKFYAVRERARLKGLKTLSARDLEDL